MENKKIDNEEQKEDTINEERKSEEEEEEEDEEYQIVKKYILFENLEDKKKFLKESNLPKNIKIMIRENVLLHYLSDDIDNNIKNLLLDDLKLINEEIYKK